MPTLVVKSQYMVHLTCDTVQRNGAIGEMRPWGRLSFERIELRAECHL
jgi:hypothetical protein